MKYTYDRGTNGVKWKVFLTEVKCVIKYFWWKVRMTKCTYDNLFF